MAASSSYSIHGRFHLGSHLCRVPAPALDELFADMSILKERGFTIVKLQEHWAIDEPEEGVFDFSRMKTLVERARSLELAVYVGLTCEQAPPWLYRRYPECRMVGIDGVPIAYESYSTLPADGKPGPCYDHPGAHEAQLRFIRKLVSELSAFENIAIWNTWQEIGYWSEAFTGKRICYCDRTIEHFRSWLAAKYGDLRALNQAWHSAYPGWELVSPERRIRVKACLPQEVDWRYFMDHVHPSRTLRDRARVIRENDPSGRPVFAHKAGPEYGSSADWTYARCQDFLGTSCYPAWAPTDRWDDAHPSASDPAAREATLVSEIAARVALPFDYLRSCNEAGSPLWAAEFQGGRISTGLHPGRVPDAADIRRWMLTAVGAGATTICFWVTRAEMMAFEQNGFSLLDSHGSETPRLSEVERIGRVLVEHSDLFGVPNLRNSETAICVDGRNWAVCSEMDDAAEHLAYTTRGWHRLFWDAGVPVDFLSLEDEAPLPRSYKLIVVPFPLSMSDAVATRLTEFAHSGGTVVCEACAGRLTELAVARRGEIAEPAATLFGVRHASITMVREPERSTRWMPAERGWGEFDEPVRLEGTGCLRGTSMRANLYIETFACTTSEPLLMHRGSPAGAINNFGDGRAILLGTIAGHSGTAYRSPDDRNWVKKLLDLAGVETTRAGKLLIRKRGNDRTEAWVLTNPSSSRIVEVIHAKGFRTATDPLGGSVELDDSGAMEIGVEPLDVRLVLLSRDAGETADKGEE